MLETPNNEELETKSSDSENTFVVPAIDFKRYGGNGNTMYYYWESKSRTKNKELDHEETEHHSETKV